MDYVLGTNCYRIDGSFYREICYYHNADKYVVLEDVNNPSDCNTALSFWLGAEADKE